MFFSEEKKINKDEILNYFEQEATIIDVRTNQEFEEGHFEKSINIELSSINDKISEIQGFGNKIIAICLSGVRSQKAVDFLKNKGIDAINGGGWQEFSTIIEKKH